MGCSNQKQQVIEVTYRQPINLFEYTKDQNIEKEILKKNEKGGVKGMNLESNQKFGFFVVEKIFEGDLKTNVKPWALAFTPPTDPQIFYPGPPLMTLEIEYVYGYSCEKIRKNLFYTKNPSNIVYSAASLGIVLNMMNNKQSAFGGGIKEFGHCNYITAVALHPDRDTVASAEIGKNGKICVWKASDPSVILKEIKYLAGSQGATCLGFSFDGIYLASADQNHIVTIWDWKIGKVLSTQNTESDSILDLSWSPLSLIFCTVGVNHLYLWNFNDYSHSFSKRQVHLDSPNFVMTCVAWSENNTLTAGQNGVIYKWKEKYSVAQSPVHSPSAVYCLKVLNDSIVTGGKDRTIKLLDLNLNIIKNINLHDIPRAIDLRGDTILCGFLNGSIEEISPDLQNFVIIQGHSTEICGVCMLMNDCSKFVSLSRDNIIAVWDAASNKCVNKKSIQINPKNDLENDEILKISSTALASDINTNNIAIGYQDGQILVTDNPNTFYPLFTLTQAKSTITVLNFSPNSQNLAAGCQDSLIFIYTTSDFSLNTKLSGHSSGISSIDWSQSSKYLKTNNSDWELFYWDLECDSMLDPESEVKDESWETWTSKVGWPVQGIYEGVDDSSHINSVDKNNTKNILAVGNDWGKVALFNYPCNKTSTSTSYTGHSDQVSCVKWSLNSQYLLSSGGSDNTLIQWRVLN